MMVILLMSLSFCLFLSKRPPYDCAAQHPKIQVKASLHPCCEDSVVICREEVLGLLHFSHLLVTRMP